MTLIIILNSKWLIIFAQRVRGHKSDGQMTCVYIYNQIVHIT